MDDGESSNGESVGIGVHETGGSGVLCGFLKINLVYFLFHYSHDKFDRKIMVSNQINQIES